MGGASELSGTIQHDADASSMKAVLESMQNIQAPVEVSRTGPDAQGGYTWLITFTGGVIVDQLVDQSFVVRRARSLSNSLSLTLSNNTGTTRIHPGIESCRVLS